METLTPVETPKKPTVSPQDGSHAAIIHISALSNYIGVPFGSILGPLIFWLIWRDESKFVDENGKESLNFNLSMLIYQFIIIIVGIVIFISSITGLAVSEGEDPFLALLAIPGIWLFVGGLGLISLIRLILVIVAAIKAHSGEVYHYPLSLRLIK